MGIVEMVDIMRYNVEKNIKKNAYKNKQSKKTFCKHSFIA